MALSAQIVDGGPSRQRSVKSTKEFPSLLDQNGSYRLAVPSLRHSTDQSVPNQARNEEKSQSMLFRFRESQAAELGLVGRTDRRPRVASSCKDLRQCERWRGEILRDISRKVSKIQDC